MRMKDCYSLYVDEMPTAQNLPSSAEVAIQPVTVVRNYEESLNLFKAFANYLVERNRTRNLGQQIHAAQSALDARNDEARRQSAIIVAEYAERLNAFLDAKQQELALETRRIEAESNELIGQFRDEREREHEQIILLTETLKRYRTFLDDAQKLLDEAETNPEKFMTRNKFYHRAAENCRRRTNEIVRLLRKIDNVDNLKGV